MTNREIAATIYSQIGGDRFKLMTGAHSFSQTENGLVFKMRGGKYFIIKLNGKDLYDLGYWRSGQFRKDKYLEARVIKEVNDVFAEDLQNAFTEMTGLYTSL